MTGLVPRAKSLLTSRAPCPALADHPEFAMMFAVTLQHFRCTVGEVREDYWLGRAWRALATDRALEGRVARHLVSAILLTGPGYGVPPAGASERERWILHVRERVLADTGRSLKELTMRVRWAAGAVVVRPARVRSLLAQAVAAHPLWADLTSYAEGLTPVAVPVVQGALALSRTPGARPRVLPARTVRRRFISVAGTTAGASTGSGRPLPVSIPEP